MRPMRHVLPIFVALACALLIGAAPANYIPQAQYCYPGFGAPPTQLCSIIPGNIGPDPLLKRSNGYRGIVGANPTSLATDVETPFDNYSWQAFVALNWTRGKEGLPPQQGLQSKGPRVWQGFSRVAQVFGNSKVMANCQVNPGEELFSIASNGNGTAATRNEEYVQASTGDPAIDVSGNWTLYERRVNGLEIAYLKAPNGKSQWNLTNLPGQARFVADKQVVDFPSVLLPGARNGAIEIKAAWRILDPAQHAANAKKYYVVRAVVAVAPDLVDRSPTALVAPICAHVDLGLVGLHIIQKNPPLSDSNLEPKWFWSTFEHVDNAPLAANACDITDPGTCTNFANSNCPAAILLGAPAYSYFNAKYPALPPNAALREKVPHADRSRRQDLCRHADFALLADLQADAEFERAVAGAAQGHRFGVRQLHAGRYAMGRQYRAAQHARSGRRGAQLSLEQRARDLPADSLRPAARLQHRLLRFLPCNGDADRERDQAGGPQFSAESGQSADGAPATGRGARSPGRGAALTRGVTWSSGPCAAESPRRTPRHCRWRDKGTRSRQGSGNRAPTACPRSGQDR
jgi:hypothetical protein